MAHRRSKGQSEMGISQIAREMALLEEHEAQQEQDEYNRAQQEMQRHQPQSQGIASSGIQDGTPMSSDEDGDEMEDGEYRDDPTIEEEENSEDYEMDDQRA